MATFARILALLPIFSLVNGMKVNIIPTGSHDIQDRYIVRLTDTSAEVLKFFSNNVEQLSLIIDRTVTIGDRRFAFISGPKNLAHRLKESRQVLAMEADQVMYALQTTNCVTQNINGIWGLDQLDQDQMKQNNAYTYGSNSDGSGVNAYIVDSGINTADPEFSGRAIWGYTDPGIILEGDTDENGHGTHCAGTVGGDTYGVAKNVNLIAVKVLNSLGRGTSSGFIAGLEWVVQHYMSNNKPKSVVNLSLGFDTIVESVDAAIQAVTDAGITVVVAAGNNYEDACLTTPAHVNNVITVGASTSANVEAYFSNWGSCLDIWAPGHLILSIDHEGPNIKSGTSMASPHVVGAIARYMSSLDTAPTPEEAAHWVTSTAIKDFLTLSSGGPATSPNKLLHMPCLTEYTTLTMPHPTDASGVSSGSSILLVVLIVMVAML